MLYGIGARCEVRASGVLCALRVTRSHAPEPRAVLFSSVTVRVCSKNEQHTEQPLQHMLQQSTKHTTVSSMLHLQPANPLPHMAT